MEFFVFGPYSPSTIHLAEDDFVAPPPGPWVRFCQQVPWARGRSAGAYRSDTISALSTAVAHRDLSLRQFSVHNPFTFSEQIGDSINHIEGVLIYLCGTVVDDAPCRYCLDGFGPFPVCVVSAANGVTPGVCANCRWARHPCTIRNANRSDSALMIRDRLFQTDQWSNFEQAINTLDAALPSQPTQPTNDETPVVESREVHNARLQVIEAARAVRSFVNARRL